jgi:hypothetical protein
MLPDLQPVQGLALLAQQVLVLRRSSGRVLRQQAPQ